MSVFEINGQSTLTAPPGEPGRSARELEPALPAVGGASSVGSRMGRLYPDQISPDAKWQTGWRACAIDRRHPIASPTHWDQKVWVKSPWRGPHSAELSVRPLEKG